MSFPGYRFDSRWRSTPPRVRGFWKTDSSELSSSCAVLSLLVLPSFRDIFFLLPRVSRPRLRFFFLILSVSSLSTTTLDFSCKTLPTLFFEELDSPPSPFSSRPFLFSFSTGLSPTAFSAASSPVPPPTGAAGTTGAGGITGWGHESFHTISNPAHSNGLWPFSPNQYPRVHHPPIGHMHQFTAVTPRQPLLAALVLPTAQVIHACINPQLFFGIVLVVSVAGQEVDGPYQAFAIILKLHQLDYRPALRPPMGIHTLILHKLTNPHHCLRLHHRIILRLIGVRRQGTVGDIFTQDGIPVFLNATLAEQLRLKSLHQASRVITPPASTTTPTRSKWIPVGGVSSWWSLPPPLLRTTRVPKQEGNNPWQPTTTELPKATWPLRESSGGLPQPYYSDAPAPTGRAWCTRQL